MKIKGEVIVIMNDPTPKWQECLMIFMSEGLPEFRKTWSIGFTLGWNEKAAARELKTAIDKRSEEAYREMLFVVHGDEWRHQCEKNGYEFELIGIEKLAKQHSTEDYRIVHKGNEEILSFIEKPTTEELVSILRMKIDEAKR